jgi:trans-2,3-dihydro-3-hydroxyanthranilate isomerase
VASLECLWLDVFTDKPFAGNAVAVFPRAHTLSTEQMQAIARELNLSETTFAVGKGAAGPIVRIFTPEEELRFAGHPTLGTAVALHGATDGKVTLELGVGPVPVSIQKTEFGARAEFLSPPARFSDAHLSDEEAAQAVGLTTGDLDPALRPVTGSCGTAFLFVAVRDVDTVSRARLAQNAAWPEGPLGIVVFALTSRAQVRARVFIPGSTVAEDAATGSANAPLAAYLHQQRRLELGELLLTTQGVEMGRPSLLEARVQKESDGQLRTYVAGGVVQVGAGTFTAGPKGTSSEDEAGRSPKT